MQTEKDHRAGLRPEAQARLNGLFVGIFFLGGAIGSALAGPIWSFGGWIGVCAICAFFGMIAPLIERR